MSPSPLSPNLLQLLLQYISPPSQLTHPFPPHLLSRPLIQRHHFLRLTPEQPGEYLCWPSSPEKVTHVLELLESRARCLDDDQPTDYPVRYSFDGEDFYAHVDLSCGAGTGPRLILQWDGSGDWKYHNTDLLPFPPGSRSALEDVLVPPPPPRPVSLQPFSSTAHIRRFDVDDLRDDSDDDDYWNAYGSTDIGDSAYSEGAHASAKDIDSTEDAYWAQYASVQGTADSTMPSPIPQAHRKSLPALQSGNERASDSSAPLPVPVRVPSEDTYADPLPVPSSIFPRPMGHSRCDPASPTVLARLLSNLSPRPSPALDGSFVGSFDVEEEELSSPTIGGSNKSDLSCSPGLGAQGPKVVVVSPPIEEDELQLETPEVASNGLGVHPVGDNGRILPDDEGEDEDEADLCAALEGVWRMWKKTRGRATGPNSAGDSETREVFLRAAQLVADRA